MRDLEAIKQVNRAAVKAIRSYGRDQGAAKAAADLAKLIEANVKEAE